GFLSAVRTHAKPRQHGELSESQFADRAGALASDVGRLPGGGAPTPERKLESHSRTAFPGSLWRRRCTSIRQGFWRAEQGKGNRPLPLQPHPQNQPTPNGEGI